MGEAKEVLSLQMSGDHSRDIHLIFLAKCFHSYEEKRGRRSNMKKIPKTTLFDIY